MIYAETSVARPVRFPHPSRMTVERLAIDSDRLKDELDKRGRSQSALGRFMKIDPAIVNRMANGTRKISAEEADQIRAYLSATGGPAAEMHTANTPDLPEVDPLEAYVEIEVLPTHGGMGGGGTGDADRRTTLMPRSLVESLGAQPADLLLMDCEGDSMIPLFFHGDRVLLNRRKTSLAQPGVFGLWDGDGYVLKNVERDRQAGTIKVFSENPKYSPRTYGMDDDNLVIVGRPEWFARRV